MAAPNVLLLDEPTNDLDIETLSQVEDLLDGWAGHGRRRQPRPVVPRAGVRRDVGAARRRDSARPARRRRRVPRAAARHRGCHPSHRRSTGPVGDTRATRKELTRIERRLERIARGRTPAPRPARRARDRSRAGARSRRSSCASWRRRRPSSRTSGWTSPTTSTRPSATGGASLAGDPLRRGPSNVVGEVQLLERPDDPGGRVELTAQHAVAGGGRIGVVQVVPGLAHRGDREPPDVARAVASRERLACLSCGRSS